MSERWIERLLALIREGEEEREKLWRAYEAAASALVEYAKALARGEVQEAAAQLAADAALTAFEYLLAAAVESGLGAVAEVLARMDERLLVAFAVRLAAREERGWGG